MRSGLPKALSWVLVAMLAALALSGCRPTPSPTEKLNTAIHAFHAHMVFDRYDQAGLFLPPRQQNKFVRYYEDQRGDLHITEYEVYRLEIAPDERSAKAEVVLSWYRPPSMQLHTSRMTETWEWTEEPGFWEVVQQDIFEIDGETVLPEETDVDSPNGLSAKVNADRAKLSADR